MLESTESLLPHSNRPGLPLRTINVGFDTESPESLDELQRLLTTLGAETIDRVTVPLKRLNPATYIGSGKLEELKLQMATAQADALIFDVELSPNQMRNIENVLGKPILDRPGVIIEIFSRHARSKEAKTQVELARMQYLLPRLAHFWSHFERQRGGIGNKGMGETQIEVDRRLVKDRMQILRGRLKTIEKERKVQRSGRKQIFKVALVGYTNAGKSTLLNALTHSEVRAEDKLFATLDPSVRALDPHSHPPIVAIDTVGFISNLPPSLVASFRSTLEELHQADLLLHVVDASSQNAKEQAEVTEQILNDLGLEAKPRLVVLNKADQLQTPGDRNRARVASPGAQMISAFNPEEVTKLRDMIQEQFRKNMEVWEVVIPYAESKIDAQLHAVGSIENSRHIEKGTFYRLRIDTHWAKKLGLEKFRT